MKNIFLIFLLFLATNIFGQGKGEMNNNTVPLKEDFPLVIKNVFNIYFNGLYKTSELKIAELNTSIDSLQVYFGIADNDKNKFYWAAITNNDSLLSFSSLPLEKRLIGNIHEWDVTLKLGKDRPEKIKFELIFNDDSNRLTYHWLDKENNRIEKMKIIGIDKFRLENNWPNLSLTKLDSEPAMMKDYQGKLVVMNWWHTRCGPCIAEMPGLNKLVKAYEDNKEIIFLAIADNKPEEVAHFLNKRTFKYQHSLSTHATKNFLGESYPKHFIVGTDNKIKFYLEGGGKKVHKELDVALKELLN